MGFQTQSGAWARPTMWPMRAPLIAVLTTAALAGCGGGGGDPAARATATATPTPTGTATATATATFDPATASGPERAIADLLRRYAAAVRAGDARTICRELLEPSISEVAEQAGGTCERNLMGPRIREAGPDYAIDIASIEVAGDLAVARITATERDGPRESRQAVSRDGGAWRLAILR